VANQNNKTKKRKIKTREIKPEIRKELNEFVKK